MIFALVGVIGIAFFIAKDRAVEEVRGVQMQSSPNWTRYDAAFKAAANARGIDWTILKAIAMNESSLGAHPSVARGIAAPYDIEGSKSDDGKSWGIMQFTIPTARMFDPAATEIKLNNPEYSIKLAAQFIQYLQKQFDSTSPRYLESIVKSYNQGEGNMRKELNGTGGGFANEYWARFQRNREKVRQS